MVRVRHVTGPILLLAGLMWAGEAREEDPDLLLRVAPPVSIAPPGGISRILLTAEIVGPETEEYYCPEVVWLWPNGTRSSQESDCAPFAEREHYPRRFTRRIGAYAYFREYMACVELRKGGEVIDRSCARYRVR